MGNTQDFGVKTQTDVNIISLSWAFVYCAIYFAKNAKTWPNFALLSITSPKNDVLATLILWPILEGKNVRSNFQSKMFDIKIERCIRGSWAGAGRKDTPTPVIGIRRPRATLRRALIPNSRIKIFMMCAFFRCY